MSNPLKASEYMPITQSNRSPEVQQTLKVVKKALRSIQAIIKSPTEYTPDDLEKSLGEISHFFRTATFWKVIIPVLDWLVQDDRERWENAIDMDTLKPVTPHWFESFPKSTAEVKQAGLVIHPAQREREMKLLGVYGITMDTVYTTFSLLWKNK